MAADFDPKRLEKAWARYRAKATEAHTPFTTYLNDGATTNQIDSAERTVSCEFPADLRQLLSLHNGGKEYHVLPGWELFSAERIADEWKIWEDLYRTQFKPENYNCEPCCPIEGEAGCLRYVPQCPAQAPAALARAIFQHVGKSIRSELFCGARHTPRTY